MGYRTKPHAKKPQSVATTRRRMVVGEGPGGGTPRRHACNGRRLSGRQGRLLKGCQQLPVGGRVPSPQQEHGGQGPSQRGTHERTGTWELGTWDLGRAVRI